ncbi:MAG: leucine--tRNA ligase [Proteobacteria bacterium]|nr:leucine--tRNA ligase [Pseudomonadota bacterium]
MSDYKPSEIEAKWQARWAQDKTFAVAEEAGGRPKFYMLEMFPYPSGKLHMGHVRNYSIGDVMARYRRAQGFDVLHPMGWDAFGLPAENAARENNTHPAKWTRSNIATMRGQLKQLGFSYDWDRELATCDPDYYRWEQAVFIKMWEQGLAYRKKGLLNWCDGCGTVLANEQVEDGDCWRGHGPVRQREMEQWNLRITNYCDELLDGLDTLEGWPSAVKVQQRAWIGKSHGASILFAVDGQEQDIEVFTTRPDTLYGCTFMSLAPEHPLTRQLCVGTPQEADVLAFIDAMGTVEKAERMDDKTEKQGLFIGRHAINPVNGRRIPIYTANFVLADYGTGAVMAVPAHDQRDFEFAQKYGIDLQVVIQPEGEEPLDVATMEAAFTGEGTMVHSGTHDGTPNEAGKTAVVAQLTELCRGSSTINYRLRDWGLSRQRFWGCPVPMVHCEACGIVPVPEADLPVLLPEDVSLGDHGGSPLPVLESFWKVDCPKCGADARRDTDTFDTFMESSWYQVRYCSPDYDQGMVDPAAAKRFLPVDQYVGGIEHAVMHLLYARFYMKVLRDLGIVEGDEPFTNLLCQGMVCHETYSRGEGTERKYYYPNEIEDGRLKADGKPVDVGPVIKMSKSKKNTVDPEKLLAHYGADVARLFCLFAAPPHKDVDWSDSGVDGCWRFLSRVWRAVDGNAEAIKAAPDSFDGLSKAGKDLRRTTHQTIATVTDDIERRMQFNTAIARCMELTNALSSFKGREGADGAAFAEGARALVRLLSPFAPHIANELWTTLGGEGLLEDQPWPVSDEAVTAVSEVTIVVMVGGKRRDEIQLPADVTEDDAIAAAMAREKVQKWVGEKPPRFVKYVPGRLVNIVPG